MQPTAAAATDATDPPLTLSNLCFLALWQRAVRPSWLAVAACAAVVFMGAALGPFDYLPYLEAAMSFGAVGTFLFGALVFASNDRPRTALLLESFGLTLAVALSVPALTTMIASLDMPYRDADLLAWDNALGFDWEGIVLWVRARPNLSIMLSHCYASLLWQPVFLMAILAYVAPERLRRMMVASTLALIATVLIFIWFPARTGYVHLGYERSDFPHLLANTSWGVYEILEAVRGGERTLSLEGLVTFPSYHASAAVLFIYAWAAVPVLRWPFMILNAVMLIACVPIGSHYVVDLIGGIILAYAGYLLADWYFARTDKVMPLATWDKTSEGRAIAAWSARIPLLTWLLKVKLA
jgi:membrane-associated phospholipid phosphatase